MKKKNKMKTDRKMNKEGREVNVEGDKNDQVLNEIIFEEKNIKRNEKKKMKKVFKARKIILKAL